MLGRNQVRLRPTLQGPLEGRLVVRVPGAEIGGARVSHAGGVVHGVDRGGRLDVLQEGDAVEHRQERQDGRQQRILVGQALEDNPGFLHTLEVLGASSRLRQELVRQAVEDEGRHGAAVREPAELRQTAPCGGHVVSDGRWWTAHYQAADRHAGEQGAGERLPSHGLRPSQRLVRATVPRRHEFVHETVSDRRVVRHRIPGGERKTAGQRHRNTAMLLLGVYRHIRSNGFCSKRRNTELERVPWVY